MIAHKNVFPWHISYIILCKTAWFEDITSTSCQQNCRHI